MRSTSKAIAMLALAAGMSSSISVGSPLDYHIGDLWSPSGTTNAKRAPRKHSTHKQNARKARKGRK